MADASGYRDRGLGDHRRHSNHKRTRGETRGEGRGGDEDELDDAKRVRRRYDDYERGSGKRHEHRYDESRHTNSSLREGRGDYHTNSNPSKRSPSVSSTRHGHSSEHHHHRHHRHHHHRHRHSSTTSTRTPSELPLGARALVRSDFETFRPLFAQYLEVQKRKDITALDEREIKGRWKSFVGKWNRGELAEGWYSPETLSEARKYDIGGSTGAQLETEDRDVSAATSPLSRERGYNRERSGGGGCLTPSGREEGQDDDDDDGYGPTLPGSARAHSHPREHLDSNRSTKHGPGIPSRQDLDLRRETAEEERAQRILDLRLERKADRAEQRARLDELAPRAEPGTRERRLEKKREVNEKMRGYRDKSPGGGGAEVGEAELMGGDGDGGGDSVAEYKRLKAAAERRKTEREIRREEEARIRAAEREERVREYRRREEDTMEVLKRIARERFGSG
ncbi:uncharacterized protein F4812DRAFT_464958 [Daldinia caldariorum]|uniref:uncharacterized protein n=1 Tax=Daldinia caldariorum TaxID=326644 RepID=UPI0020075696|nr:uncharacterized protein F4812DRAFT_464958 [Daldinia caldariorum]KAI1473018.1 hypothetical protein F4812DRAFT_464958 [Daldinia caldariorum]